MVPSWSLHSREGNSSLINRLTDNKKIPGCAIRKVTHAEGTWREGYISFSGKESCL